MSTVLSTLSADEIILCSAIVFAAAILQMSVGMGFGMIASPLIALVRPDIVPGTIMLIGLVVAASGAWRERANISVIELKLGIGGRLVGSLFAFGILSAITQLGVFMIFFGLTMLAAILLAASGIRVAFNGRNLFGLSVVSGLAGTITAVGAPPMAVIYHHRPANVVRPTLNAFFGAGSIIGLMSLLFAGWLDWQDAFAAVVLLPAMLGGVYVARFFTRISSGLFSNILLGTSALASCILVYRGFGF